MAPTREGSRKGPGKEAGGTQQDAAAGPPLPGLDDDSQSQAELEKFLHTRRILESWKAEGTKACARNFSAKAKFLSVSEAELQDLRSTDKDEKFRRAPGEMARFRMDCMVLRGTNKEAVICCWPARTRLHIRNLCSRMVGRRQPLHRRVASIPSLKPDRDLLRELATIHFKKALAEGPRTSGDNEDRSSGNDQILVPNLVTFVACTADAAAQSAATEIKLLAPGEQDSQDGTTFCRNLTDSFSCKRVRAPDVVFRYDKLAPHVRRRFIGKFADRCVGFEFDPAVSRTVLVFAAGVCFGRGPEARGGIGIVTKDTVHYHEAKVQARVLDAAERLHKHADREDADDMRKMGLCVAAYRKPNRGHSQNLYPAGPEGVATKIAPCPNLGGIHSFVLERRGPSTEPDSFGFVRNPHSPGWKDMDEDGMKEIIMRAPPAERMPTSHIEEERGAERTDAGGGGDTSKESRGKEPMRAEMGGHGQQSRSALDGSSANRPSPAGNSGDGDESEDRHAPITGADEKAVPTQRSETEPPKARTDCSSEPAAATDGRIKGTLPVRSLGPAPSRTADPEPATDEEQKPSASAGPSKAARPGKRLVPIATPQRAADCTRLVVATDSEYAIDCATNQLEGWLERGLPLRTEAGERVRDADLWWAFAGAVKDLAWQGVEVAIVRCRRDEGVYLPLGDWHPQGEGGKRVYGMPQAVEAARQAALSEERSDEFTRYMSMFA